MRNVRKLHWILLFSLLAPSGGLAKERAKESSKESEEQSSSGGVENPLFGYTHTLPSPFTLRGGTFVLGTTAAYGLTDFLQIGTELLRDFYQFFNASLKVSFVDRPQMAMAATLGFETFNFRQISETLPDRRVYGWQPGLVIGHEIIPSFAGFLGGNLNFTQSDLSGAESERSGFERGAEVRAEWSWAYNPRKSGVGNVLSGGVSYDVTYKTVGFGFSHHWRGFHVGLHYYPNASKYHVQPILAGGATVEL